MRTDDSQEPEEVNAHTADDSVILLPADQFRLPEVLKLIESGKIVIVTPASRDAALA